MTVLQVEDGQGSLTAVTVVDESNSTDVPNLKGDWHNIFVLILLYTMQGFGTSLTIGVPIILQGNKNVTYKDQALITMATWPFSLKMIWAPLVDALYIQKVGRRKSWLLPVQILMGGCFIYMGINIEEWISADRGKPNILKLFYPILFVQALVATQFIVIDSWVLTMLKKNNVGYGPTCSVIGFPFGTMFGSFIMVEFTSENFCNKYLRFTPDTGGITTLPEKCNRLEDNHRRLIWNITFVIFISYTTRFITINGNIGFPIHSYAILVFLFIVNSILGMTMKSAKYTLFSRISDPRFGGIYMGLLNTFSSCGMFSSTSLAISLIDFLTLKACLLNYNNNCSTSSPNNACKTNRSSCFVLVNGYYVESVLCILFGIGWYYVFSGTFKSAQIKSSSHWMVNVKNNTVKKNETTENNG
ncbi:acetyl-coenzyme A transporter 1-like [Rhopalosiphum maidis]|uniref:acetyl-coenzyme A transporter 1-like n=1 Tax=Rhopalosiphum maidis TaxID=43146 RepID=UPI000EFF1B54|nr:acetyl-coenzyme A transporter 1-like [Rhopalosiphum maidis]